MASLSHILVLCVGLLAMVNAGESGEGSPTTHFSPKGGKGRGNPAREPSWRLQSELSRGTRKLGSHVGSSHRLVSGGGERMPQVRQRWRAGWRPVNDGIRDNL